MLPNQMRTDFRHIPTPHLPSFCMGECSSVLYVHLPGWLPIRCPATLFLVLAPVRVPTVASFSAFLPLNCKVEAQVSLLEQGQESPPCGPGNPLQPVPAGRFHDLQKAVISRAQMAAPPAPPQTRCMALLLHGPVIKANIFKATSCAESKERRRMHKTPKV